MALAVAIAPGVADEHPISATLSISVQQNGRSIPMALVQYDVTTDRIRRSLRDTVNTLRGHFVRYRFALYLFSGAAVASGLPCTGTG
jgi:hypothetical protein